MHGAAAKFRAFDLGELNLCMKFCQPLKCQHDPDQQEQFLDDKHIAIRMCKGPLSFSLLISQVRRYECVR